MFHFHAACYRQYWLDWDWSWGEGSLSAFLRKLRWKFSISMVLWWKYMVLWCCVVLYGIVVKFLWVPSPEGALSSIPGFFYCNPNFTANFEKIEAGVQNSHVGATGDQLL